MSESQTKNFSIDNNTIKHLSKLSRIDCTEEDCNIILKDLSSILNYVTLLDEVDTEGVAPCNHVLEDFVNVMREDEVGPILSRDVFLSNAPSQIGGMIRVPQVLKNHI